MSKNTITGLFSVALGVIYMISTINLEYEKTGYSAGPKMYPYIVGCFIILLGVVLLIKEMRTPRESRITLPKLDNEGKTVLIRIAITALMGIIYGLILDPVGYLISTTLFMLGLMFMINSLERWKRNIIVSVGFSLVTYIGFATLLHLSLPRGLFSF